MVKIYKENETIYMEDNGDIVDLTNHIIVDKKTGRDVIKLPENSANRQWIMVDKITEEGIELAYKETRTIGARLPGVDKKPYIEYLTDDELAEYNRLVEIAKQRKAEAEKRVPMSKEDKLRARIAKLQAQIDALITEEVDE